MPRWCVPLFVILAVTGCAVNPVTGRPDFVLFTARQEIESGKVYHERVTQEFSLYNDEELVRYVGNVGRRLATQSHRPELDYRFFVLDSPLVNAFALPGGYVYVTRGILAYLDDESQLAAVLGHEIGHIAARHGVRQQSQDVVVGVLGSIANAATRSVAISDLSSVLGSVLLNGYGRRHELEADRLGAEYLARSGYDPAAMMDVIDALKDQEIFEIDRARTAGREPSVYHGVFSTHPSNDRRLSKAIETAGALRTGAVEEPATDRDDFLGRVESMLFGPSRDQGMMVGGGFVHAGLDVFVPLPSQWRTENRPDRLVSVAPDGDAIIQVVLGDRGNYGTPLEYLEASFPDLAGAGELRGAALPAASGFARLSTPFGERRSRVAAVFHHGRVFVMAGIRETGGIPELDASAQRMRALTAAERSDARERVLSIVVASEGDTYESISRRIDARINDPDVLRLLNGDYPAGQPSPGRRVKTISYR